MAHNIEYEKRIENECPQLSRYAEHKAIENLSWTFMLIDVLNSNYISDCM